MALGKHNARVRILSERIARGLGNALVAPVIAYVPEGRLSPPTGHMRFPGTITVPDDVFQKGLESAARSFVLHGFRDVVFLGDHGSTQAGQKAVAARLNREWAGASARAHAIEEYYRASDDDFKRLLAGRGYRRGGARRATRGSPTRRSCWRSIRGSCGSIGCGRAPGSARAVTASTETRPARRPSSGGSAWR